MKDSARVSCQAGESVYFISSALGKNRSSKLRFVLIRVRKLNTFSSIGRKLDIWPGFPIFGSVTMLLRAAHS